MSKLSALGVFAFFVCVAVGLDFGLKPAANASPYAVQARVEPAQDNGKGHYILSNHNGDAAGFWVQQTVGVDHPFAALYTQRTGTFEHSVLGFSRDQSGKHGHDFAIVTNKDEVYFQIHMGDGKWSFVPVTALTKLNGDAWNIGFGFKADPGEPCCKACKCGDGIKRPPAAQAPGPKVVKGKGEPVAFEAALRAELANHPDHPHTAHVLKVLNMEPGAKRDRVLSRMERHVRTHLDLPEGTVIDWLSSVDWVKLFDTIVKLIMMLLPFLGL